MNQKPGAIMTTDRITSLDMTVAEVIGALSANPEQPCGHSGGCHPGAVRVLLDLFKHSGILVVLLCDSKRLYAERIWDLYKNVCGEDIERFAYHLSVELPNQETGVLSVTGPQSPDFDDREFWKARSYGAPGSFWCLQNPPGPGYRFPLTSSGTEAP